MISADDPVQLLREFTDIAALTITDPQAGAQRLVRTIATRLGIELFVNPAMPASGLAYRSQRRIELKPLTRDVDPWTWVAVALHECGHVLSPPCRGADHFHDRDASSKYSYCLACETEAWRRAMALFPFSDAMHERMVESLRHYLKTTSAPFTARVAAEALVKTGPDVDMQRWRELGSRIARQRRAVASIEADRVRTGAYPCANHGCRGRSFTTRASEYGEVHLCQSCDIDARMADTTAKVAAMRAKAAESTETGTAAHGGASA